MVKKLDFDPKKSWLPDLFVANAIGNTKETIKYSIALHNKENSSSSINFKNLTIRVTELRKLEGIFYERLELYDFPMDSQELSVKLSSYKKVDEIKFVEIESNKSFLNNGNFADQQQWDLFENVKVTIEDVYDNIKKCTRTQFMASCFVTRKTGFYLYK